MDTPEVEADGFEAGEVFTGPHDCQIVLYYDHQRFILTMAKPESREDGDVVADLFLKLEEAENDPDEMMVDRCLEDVRENAISACKQTMYTLAASVQKLNSKQLSLEDFLHPTTFYLQLRTVKGKLQAFEIDDISNFTSIHEPVRLPMDFVPRSVPAPPPSVELGFIEDLFMRKVLKVSKNDVVWVFKSATYGNEGQLKREINVLQQISERWEPDHPGRPRVPRFLGLVASESQMIGMLEEFIDGTNRILLDLLPAPETTEASRGYGEQGQPPLGLSRAEDMWGKSVESGCGANTVLFHLDSGRDFFKVALCLPSFLYRSLPVFTVCAERLGITTSA